MLCMAHSHKCVLANFFNGLIPVDIVMIFTERITFNYTVVLSKVQAEQYKEA